jgi:hypothetical protein
LRSSLPPLEELGMTGLQAATAPAVRIATRIVAPDCGG